MKGLCTKIIKHDELHERPDVADYPTYEVVAQLSYPIEEGEHMHLELNEMLTLRDVKALQLHGDVYSLTFDIDHQDEYADCNTRDVLAAMQYAYHAEVSVGEVVTAMRQNIRAAVPEEITAEVTLEGTVIRVKLADGIHNLPLRSVYLQHLLNGPMRFTWRENDDGGLRMHFNMPPEAELTEWFTQHNLVLRDAIKDIPEVAACCLALTSEKSRDLSYGYIVVMMNGGMMVTPMNIGQILCMVASGRQPEVEALFGAEGLNLTVHNDDLLPQALPYLEQITDEQLALTASL